MKKLKTFVAKTIMLAFSCSVALPISSFAAPMERVVKDKGKWVLIQENIKKDEKNEEINMVDYYDNHKIKSIINETYFNSNQLAQVARMCVEYDVDGNVVIVKNENQINSLRGEDNLVFEDGKLAKKRWSIVDGKDEEEKGEVVYLYDAVGKYVKEARETRISQDGSVWYTLYIYDIVTKDGEKQYSCKEYTNLKSDFKISDNKKYVSNTYPDLEFTSPYYYEKKINNRWYYSRFGNDKDGLEYKVQYSKDGRFEQILEIKKQSRSATKYTDWEYDTNGNPIKAKLVCGSYDKETGKMTHTTEGEYSLQWKFFPEKKKATEISVDKEKPDNSIQPVETNKVGSVFAVNGNKYKVTGSVTDKVKIGEVTFTALYTKAMTVKIPDTVKIDGKTYKVTSISANALKNNKDIKSVVIGKNVKKIGKSAFYGCSKLKSITIKTTKLTKKKVGKNAFAKIHKKARATVPKKKLKTYKKMLKARGMNKKTQKVKAAKK